MSITPEMEMWLRDLETTAAPQTIGELRENLADAKFAYCCLGRACEVATANGVKNATCDYMCPDVGHLYMPAAAADWLGLTESQQARCVDWNDDDSLTFPQIAAKLRGELSS